MLSGREDIANCRDAWREKVASSGRRYPFVLHLDANRTGRGWKIDESHSRPLAAILADDRIESAEVRLYGGVRPAPLQKLELIFDARSVAEEHEPAISRYQFTLGLFHSYELRTIRNAAPQNHANKAVGRQPAHCVGLLKPIGNVSV